MKKYFYWAHFRGKGGNNDNFFLEFLEELKPRKIVSEIFWPLRQPFGNLIKVSKELWAEHGTVNSPYQKLPFPRVVSKSSFISFAISELFFCTSNTVLTYFERIFVSFNGIEYMIQLSSDSAESPKDTFETMPLKSRGWGPYPIRPSESQGTVLHFSDELDFFFDKENKILISYR